MGIVTVALLLLSLLLHIGTWGKNDTTIYDGYKYSEPSDKRDEGIKKKKEKKGNGMDEAAAASQVPALEANYPANVVASITHNISASKSKQSTE